MDSEFKPYFYVGYISTATKQGQAGELENVLSYLMRRTSNSLVRGVDIELQTQGEEMLISGISPRGAEELLTVMLLLSLEPKRIDLCCEADSDALGYNYSRVEKDVRSWYAMNRARTKTLPNRELGLSVNSWQFGTRTSETLLQISDKQIQRQYLPGFTIRWSVRKELVRALWSQVWVANADYALQFATQMVKQGFAAITNTVTTPDIFNLGIDRTVRVHVAREEHAKDTDLKAWLSKIVIPRLMASESFTPAHLFEFFVKEMCRQMELTHEELEAFEIWAASYYANVYPDGRPDSEVLKTVV